MRPIYVVDAFADRPFAGNPAGVCLAIGDESEEWMQSVAAEMRHAETAFVWRQQNSYRLRWFTPTTEVDLCGHATLATAKVLWDRGCPDDTLAFETRSGTLLAEREGDRIGLDFPSEPADAADPPPNLEDAIGTKPTWVGKNRMDWIAQVGTEADVRSMVPDLDAIASLGMRGLIVTAPASAAGLDFVSRFFAPQSGVPEDPVTGSAHCCLAPFWSERLGKSEMIGYQASERGGLVGVRMHGKRVKLTGSAIVVLSGELHA